MFPGKTDIITKTYYTEKKKLLLTELTDLRVQAKIDSLEIGIIRVTISSN